MVGERQQEGWQAYYDATAKRPPRRTLLAALAGFGADGARRAVDLGCGDGRDAIELLRRGWSVFAIDAEKLAIERLLARADLPAGAQLSTLVARFEDAVWPEADLVNAGFSLPLCLPERFPALWCKIRDSLAPGGRFAGQLYGDRDGWAGDPGMTHLDRAAVLDLLAEFAVEMFEEEESDGLTPRSNPKHWHVFHIVARRR